MDRTTEKPTRCPFCRSDQIDIVSVTTEGHQACECQGAFCYARGPIGANVAEAVRKWDAGTQQTKKEMGVLWKQSKAAWNALGEIERGARQTRKTLPDNDPLRMKFLTLETLAALVLAKPRKSLMQTLQRLEVLMEGDPVPTPCPECGGEAKLFEHKERSWIECRHCAAGVVTV